MTIFSPESYPHARKEIKRVEQKIRDYSPYAIDEKKRFEEILSRASPRAKKIAGMLMMITALAISDMSGKGTAEAKDQPDPRKIAQEMAAPAVEEMRAQQIAEIIFKKIETANFGSTPEIRRQTAITLIKNASDLFFEAANQPMRNLSSQDWKQIGIKLFELDIKKYPLESQRTDQSLENMKALKEAVKSLQNTGK